MFCSKCGAENPDGLLYCVRCGAGFREVPGFIAPAVNLAVTAEIRAGFWVRMAALFIDGVLVNAACSILNYSLSGDIYGESFTGFFINILTAMNYYTYFIGKCGQTPGKMAMRIKVLSVSGEKVGYITALARFLCYFIDIGTFCVGFLMAGIRADKLALHDLIAGTKVIRVNGQ